jgi:hypothetical protein
MDLWGRIYQDGGLCPDHGYYRYGGGPLEDEFDGVYPDRSRCGEELLKGAMREDSMIARAEDMLVEGGSTRMEASFREDTGMCRNTNTLS